MTASSMLLVSRILFSLSFYVCSHLLRSLGNISLIVRALISDVLFFLLCSVSLSLLPFLLLGISRTSPLFFPEFTCPYHGRSHEGSFLSSYSTRPCYIALGHFPSFFILLRFSARHFLEMEGFHLHRHTPPFKLFKTDTSFF